MKPVIRNDAYEIITITQGKVHESKMEEKQLQNGIYNGIYKIRFFCLIVSALGLGSLVISVAVPHLYSCSVKAIRDNR